jgi:hypothetical protein
MLKKVFLVLSLVVVFISAGFIPSDSVSALQKNTAYTCLINSKGKIIKMQVISFYDKGGVLVSKKTKIINHQYKTYQDCRDSILPKGGK